MANHDKKSDQGMNDTYRPGGNADKQDPQGPGPMGVIHVPDSLKQSKPLG